MKTLTLISVLCLASCGIDTRTPGSTEAEVVAPKPRVQFWGTCTTAAGETCFRAVCAEVGDSATALDEAELACAGKGTPCAAPAAVVETKEPCCWEQP